VVLASGNEYDVRADSDADALLIACMVLSISMTEDGNDGQNTVTIDIGNIGPEARPFDEPGNRANRKNDTAGNLSGGAGVQSIMRLA